MNDIVHYGAKSLTIMTRIGLFLESQVFLLIILACQRWILFRLRIPGYVFLLLGLGQAQGLTPLTEWTAAYSMVGSHEVDKNALLTMLPKLTKEWRLSDYKFTFSFSTSPSEGTEAKWEIAALPSGCTRLEESSSLQRLMGK